MLRLSFILGGVMSVVSSRFYKSWEKYDSKDVDEIVHLNLYVD